VLTDEQNLFKSDVIYSISEVKCNLVEQDICYIDEVIQESEVLSIIRYRGAVGSSINNKPLYLIIDRTDF
jgi:hypothetical protein